MRAQRPTTKCGSRREEACAGSASTRRRRRQRRAAVCADGAEWPRSTACHPLCHGWQRSSSR
jgi:hypothetical protein